MSTEFHIGDKVNYMGWVGKVEQVLANSDYPVKCIFKDESGPVEEDFTTDGRVDIKHTIPSLKLVQKARKQKKKLYPAVFQSDKDGSFYVQPRLFESEKAAVAYSDKFVHLLEDWVIEFEL